MATYVNDSVNKNVWDFWEEDLNWIEYFKLYNL